MAQAESWTQRNFFLLRRLHSLSGIIPVGVFLVGHLFVNSRIVASGEAFQVGVDQIHLLNRLGILGLVEVVGIFLPLAFHAIVGLWIWWGSKQTIDYLPVGGNVRYSLQRITGLVTLVFLVYHLWHMHWLGEPFGGAFFDPETAPSTAAAAMQRWWFNAPVYVIGVAAAVFHLANGIWTALITWGVTVGRESQRKAGWVCGVLGVLLGAAGLASVWGFERFPQQVEAGVTVEVGMDEPIFVPD